jgi:hypothetical protein
VGDEVVKNQPLGTSFGDNSDREAASYIALAEAEETISRSRAVIADKAIESQSSSAPKLMSH